VIKEYTLIYFIREIKISIYLLTTFTKNKHKLWTGKLLLLNNINNMIQKKNINNMMDGHKAIKILQITNTKATP